MRFLRTLLYGLILVVVGLVSALTAMRFAIHGREVSVPKLTGVTAAAAQHIAADNGLEIVRDQRFYSSDVPEGRIVSQLPPAGTRVRVGFRIRIAESLGPQKAEIPNLLGQSVRSAELNLKERGLEAGSVASLPTANAVADQVIAQSPTPDAQQISTPSVNLLISAAPTGRSVCNARLHRLKALRGKCGDSYGRAGGGNHNHRAARHKLRFGRSCEPERRLEFDRKLSRRNKDAAKETTAFILRCHHHPPDTGRRTAGFSRKHRAVPS